MCGGRGHRWGFFVPGHFTSLLEGSFCSISPQEQHHSHTLGLTLRNKEDDSSFLQDLLSATLISQQATLMAFCSTPGVSPWLMGYNMLHYLRGLCTGRRRVGRYIGGDLSLSKLETETPGKRDEQKNKRSSIDLPSCYVIQILTSGDRSGAQHSCLQRESGRVGRSENTRQLQRERGLSWHRLVKKEKQMHHKNCKNKQLLWKDFRAKHLSKVYRKINALFTWQQFHTKVLQFLNENRPAP